MPHRTGQATLPLHHGRAPRWLFERMTTLARALTCAFLTEHSPQEFLERISDPYWFQALGCVLGFDWHSSGLTTTVCGALKQGLQGLDRELGLAVAGGKGATARRTPKELEAWGERFGIDPAPLIYASRMSAKVDSACVQDGYQLYHHAFFWTTNGSWAVVQQGMSEALSEPTVGLARRYHWLSDTLESFVDEPQAAICAEESHEHLLDLCAHENAAIRQQSLDLSHERPAHLIRELHAAKELTLPSRHHVEASDLDVKRFERILQHVQTAAPQDYASLVGIPGIGAKTLRALALLGELLYSTPVTFRDPARFSFAHGGKDGHPFPVDRALYDRSITILEGMIADARLGRSERLQAFRRLARYATGAV